ncbi:hypothetical protein JYT74_01255 [Crocinitomix catalasitica]|nr:hypothetical protein [Crocinitomix catalasitica]
MNERTKVIYRIIFGAVIIAAVIFLSFRYLMKGSPFIKVLALGLIIAVVYLVVRNIRKKSENNN